MDKKIFQLCESIKQEDLFNLDKDRFKANIKYDGTRCLAIKNGNDVILFGRGQHIYNKQFREIVAELETINHNFIIDGEVISEDNDFTKLQKRVLTKNPNKIAQLEIEIPVKFMVFDILKFGEALVMSEPLKARLDYLNGTRGILTGLVFKHIELCEYGECNALLERAINENLEGIIVKDMLGSYENRRTFAWRKLKLFKETTITLTKYTPNPAGIRCETEDGIAVQISGEQHNQVKMKLDSGEKCEVNIQYLTKNEETGKYRFPSFRGVVNA